MKLRLALVLFAFVCPTLAGFALVGLQSQDIGSFSAPKASPRNRVQALPPRMVSITPGAKTSTELDFRVNPGFHINSNQPGSDLLVPTMVKLSPPTNVIVGDVQYPAGQDFSLAAAPGEKLNVYTGDFSVTALVTAARNTPPGRYRVHGFLQYQACDDRACYPPAKLPIAFDVRVNRPPRPHRRNPAQSPDIHN
jgi:DsbC/DsbD-like thiol-disulfide interchange protein